MRRSAWYVRRVLQKCRRARRRPYNCYLPCSSAPNSTCLRLNASPGGLRTVKRHRCDGKFYSSHDAVIAIEPSDARQRGRVLFFAPETPDTRAKRRLVLKPDDSSSRRRRTSRRRGPRCPRSVATSEFARQTRSRRGLPKPFVTQASRYVRRTDRGARRRARRAAARGWKRNSHQYTAAYGQHPPGPQ